jgi:hypothetical protein
MQPPLNKGNHWNLLTACVATGGGGGISPTFGAALWIVDYVMQSLILGTEVQDTTQSRLITGKYCF